jgi:hypothetical protein
MRQTALAAVWGIVVCLLSLAAQASEMGETGTFKDVRAKAVELGKQYRPENVLLVFDIDNTLLAANQPLGSDQWYDWQSDLQKTEPESDQLVATDSAKLLQIQSTLYDLMHMHAPEKEQPGIVQELQARGFPTLVLTARGLQCRDATTRQLKESNYAFAQSAPPVACGLRGISQPYSLTDVAASGISAEESDRGGLGLPRDVYYKQGVFMVAGQDKGAMLLILLAHCPRRFSAVIFVDDKSKNTESVFSALTQRGIEVITYRYSNEDKEVREFSEQEKQATVKQWKALKKLITSTFPEKHPAEPKTGKP